MATVIDIANAVAATINAAEAETFASEFVATRRIVPEFEVRDLETLTVSVVPKQIVISTVTRGMTQYEVPIDIGVQKKLSSQTDYESEVVSLCGIVESIADYMHGKSLTGMSGVRWVSTAIDPIYSPAQISQQRVFTSVITLTYRVMKQW